MIFPDLPKHYQWQQTAPELSMNNSIDTVQAKAPLRGSGQTNVETWLEQHGYSTGPAAVSSRNTEEPIDWLAKDAWEFYALCVAMVCWIIFWYGVHTGAW